MVDRFAGLAASNVGLDGHMVGMPVNLGEVLVQDLGISSDDRADDVGVILR